MNEQAESLCGICGAYWQCGCTINSKPVGRLLQAPLASMNLIRGRDLAVPQEQEEFVVLIPVPPAHHYQSFPARWEEYE